MPAGYLFFDAATAATFRAAARCIVPPEEGSPGADCDAAVALADRALSTRPPRDRRLLASFLRAVELLPVLRYGRGFSRLRPEQQTAFLAWLERNRWLAKLRQGFFGLKTFALMGHYGLDATWSEIGYPGPRRAAPFYTLKRAAGPPPS